MLARCIELLLVDEQRRKYLSGACAAGIRLKPESCRLERSVGVVCGPRGLGRTTCQARITRLARKLEESGNRDLRLSTLQSHFGHHQLEHQLLGELHVR